MKRTRTGDRQSRAVLGTVTTTGTGTSGVHTASAVVPMGLMPGVQWAPTFYPSVTWPSALPQIHTGHILGDPEVVSHCPFCGSGDIVSGADQTISCSFCNRSFVVMEQPQYNSMPGQPGASTDATMPGSQTPAAPEEGIPGADEPAAAAEPPGPAGATDTPPHAPVNPQTDPDTLKKAPPFSFGKSSKVANSAYAEEVWFRGVAERLLSGRSISEFEREVVERWLESATSEIASRVRDALSFSSKMAARQDGSIFRTASGHPVDEDDFVKHVAYQVDREFLVRGR